MAGAGIEGLTVDILIHGKELSSDGDGAKQGISGSDCQGGIGLRNRNIGNEDIGRDITTIENGGAYQHNQLTRVGSANGANLSDVALIPVLPILAQQLTTSICADGIVDDANKPR